MNSIDKQLLKIKAEKRIGFMTHVIVGYPSLAETSSLIKLMADEGVDFIEMQIPFSDPLADGPTIMKACERALLMGTKVRDAFIITRELMPKIKIPLLFMAYYNTVFSYGVEKFCKDAVEVGISGVIVPDLPPEEEIYEHFFKTCRRYNLYAIRILSPASTNKRMAINSEMAKGFLYCTARQGTTDAQKGLDPKITTYLQRVKNISGIPIAVGFGISSKERVALIREFADVAVIGSAVVDIIDTSRPKEVHKNVRRFLREIGV